MAAILDPIYDIIYHDETENQEPFSIWIEQENSYVPAVQVKMVQHLPPGAYTIDTNRDGFVINKCDVNTDQLYKFNDNISNKVLEEIKDFWSKAELYKKHNFVHKRGLLLQGPPGCGKTSIINILIGEIVKLKGLVFFVKTLKNFSTLTEALSTVVRVIEKDTPIITIIEDVDQMIEANGSDSPFLNFLDGNNSIDHHLVILTSNNTNSLSSALIRPSRVDMLVSLDNPNSDIRREYLKEKGFPEDLLEECVQKTNNFSFAKLKEIFVGVVILNKTIDDVIQQLDNQTKNNFLKEDHKIGL